MCTKTTYPNDKREDEITYSEWAGMAMDEMSALREKVEELEGRLATLAGMRKPDEVFISAEPEGYPVRILQHYRVRCNDRIEAHPPSPVYDIMNEHQVERAEVLDHAIAKLGG